MVLGLPSSSSHAIIGGLVGAVLAAAGTSGVIWTRTDRQGRDPCRLAPIAAGVVALIGTWLVYRITRGVPGRERTQEFR